MVVKYALEPRYDTRKSFYGKAHVVIEDGKKTLQSYSTNVAQVKGNKAEVFGTYSLTTTRHIKEFLKQEGFKVESTKQIIKDYSQKEKEKLKKVI